MRPIDAEVQKMQDMHQAEVEKAFELGRADAKAEIMPDGTLHITVNADVANIDRILLSQEGTHYGDLYYKDDEQPERKMGKWIPVSERLPIEARHYLCSFNRPNRIDKIYVDLAYWTGGRWYGYMQDQINAWMPLPEPYREEGE